jgi:low affinity Fe/Cu permease
MRGGLPVSSVTNSGARSNHWFVRFATTTAHWAGTSFVFVTAVLIVAIWAAVGPLFKYSDSWQLVINTGTTIVTFLMVFLIQNTQNRDAKALQVKLSELILALEAANNRIAAIENASPEELDAAQQEIEARVKEQAG